ncbi:hypothetical protein C0993_001419 [Termitomyces sp. T159_Od127]|nr:hypothetical protein C0993_001419 [Termitomyces sp. T159_Od127]
MSMEHGTLTGEPVHLKYFDLSETGFAWREPLQEQLRERRMVLGDKLFFDILLEAGGIERPWTLFPPRALEDLELVLQAIELSDYDTLKKECLIYYLLKWHNDGRESRFQEERSIPSQYAILADAYWHLDAGCDISRAVSLLSDARLNGDYSSKILQTIFLSPDPFPLIVQYVRTAKPCLISQLDLWIYTQALAELSFLDAWQFQRTFNESSEVRAMLLNNLMEWCISCASHSHYAHTFLNNTQIATPRPVAIQTLLSCPFSSFEERFLHKYALEPPRRLVRTAVSLLRDLVCVRLIQSGKYAEAIKIDHEFAASTLNESKSEAEPRRKMIRELYEALPIPERTLLDAEIEGLTHGKHVPNGVSKPQLKPSSNLPIKDSMSESWEEIPRPPPSGQLNGKTSMRGALAPVSASNSLYGLSSSMNGAPPILPISSGIQPANRPRQSFTLSSSLSSSVSRQPQFQTIPVSGSSGSGSKILPSVSQPLASSNSFSPASRRANAFYKPSHVAQGVKRSFQSSLGHDMDMDHDEGMNPVVQKDTHENEDLSVQNERAQQQDRDEADWEQHELEFSVFSNAQKPIMREITPPSPQAPSVIQNGRSVLPGTFSSDQEDEPEAEARLPTPPPVARTRTSSRRTQSRRTMQTAQAPEHKRPRRSEHPGSRLKQSVPGALVSSDEEEEEQEEEEDQIAPLPSPPRRGTARKARDTTPASDVGDEEAGQRRRRSSRLSSTGGELVKKAGSSGTTVGKTKKSTTRATGKKKR